MPHYYLRMEGVNLYAFLEDTLDLSTIRGGSLLLRGAVEVLQEEARGSKMPSGALLALEPISTGASEGLFRFEAPDEGSALKLRRDLAEKLRSHPKLRHATLVLDVHEAADDFNTAKESVMAANRWRQFQQPTVVLPDMSKRKRKTGKRSDLSETARNTVKACALDHLRPGVIWDSGKDWLSLSTHARRRFGKAQKQAFYTDELKTFTRKRPEDPSLDALLRQLDEMSFSRDLQALTDAPGRAHEASTRESRKPKAFDSLADDRQQNALRGKMCVIYLDGNGFGKIRQNAVQGAPDSAGAEEKESEFDRYLKEQRAGVLRRLLKCMVDDVGFQSRGELLLETLLWGGDELTWVVPAWKGWEVLSLFYSLSKDWKFESAPLTHAGGMVFCHHNAPIHRITDLAKKLAEAAKKEAKQGTGNRNLFQYLVLESFDQVGKDLAGFRTKQFTAPAADRWMVSLKGEDMIYIAKMVAEAREEIPRGKVYAAVHAAVRDIRNVPVDVEGTHTALFEKRLKQVLPAESLKRVEGSLGGLLGPKPGLWLHLAELWDYIPDHMPSLDGEV